MTDTKTIAGIKFSYDAAYVLLAFVDPVSVVLGDLKAVRSGEHNEESLLEMCLDGAEGYDVDGWKDYVAAIVAAAVEVW